MPRRLVAAACGALLLASPKAVCPTVRAAAGKRDAELERGIRHVEAGEWNQALKELGGAGGRLSRDPSRKNEAAEAFLYSGLAYIGLGETSPAISQFAQALMRNPQIKLPAGRDSQAALDAFEVARRESVAPPEPKAGGKSKAPFVIAGVAAAGAGVALAASGGGGAASDNNNPIPRTFTVTGATGTPQLLLLNAVPSSSSTVQLRETAPILVFVFNNEAALPARVQIFSEMVGPRGPCITGNSNIAEVDRGSATTALEVNSWGITCTGPFTTLTMNARLFDADAKIPVSLTSYSGGYIFLR